MLLLGCPHCGERNVSEFHYGGEYSPRPSPSTAAGDEEWHDYLYLRDNPMGPRREWWIHRAGCGLWFLAERDRRTNAVSRTFRWSPDGAGAQSEVGGAGGESDAPEGAA